MVECLCTLQCTGSDRTPSRSITAVRFAATLQQARQRLQGQLHTAVQVEQGRGGQEVERTSTMRM